ncbi:MAG: hypothetical protein WCP97_03665 [bacterium]
MSISLLYLSIGAVVMLFLWLLSLVIVVKLAVREKKVAEREERILIFERLTGVYVSSLRILGKHILPIPNSLADRDYPDIVSFLNANIAKLEQGNYNYEWGEIEPEKGTFTDYKIAASINDPRFAHALSDHLNRISGEQFKNKYFFVVTKE